MRPSQTGAGASADHEHAARVAQAIAVHAQWKETLAEAIAAGTTSLDPTAVARDDRCELGCWLHDLAKTQRASDPHLAAILAEHRRFHAQAAKVLGMAIAGRRSAAQRALEGEYAWISSELQNLLRTWPAI